MTTTKTTGKTITGKKNNIVNRIEVSVIRFKKPPAKPAAFLISILYYICVPR